MSSDNVDHDLILDDSLQLFENGSLMDSGDSAIHLSLDDIASFTNTIVATDGSHASFDTSMETSRYLIMKLARSPGKNVSPFLSVPSLDGVMSQSELTTSIAPSRVFIGGVSGLSC